jgi:hypothetical protein
MIYITTYPLPQRINHNAQTHTDYGDGRGDARPPDPSLPAEIIFHAEILASPPPICYINAIGLLTLGS